MILLTSEHINRSENVPEVRTNDAFHNKEVPFREQIKAEIEQNLD